MATLGVVIPTKNSLALLPRHLEALMKWIDLATEVVVVDSHSCDGTLEFLRERLRHANLRFLSHPPGLYESWNHGLGHLTTDFAYLSTVGDTITRDGLLHLRDTMAALRVDVVLSRPFLTSVDGGSPRKWELPVDLILQDCPASTPRRLRPAEMAIYAMLFPGGALLGSSASNLYRTSFLQTHPFPADHGPAGDGVWAVDHVFDAAWAVTPLRFSTFLEHPRSHSAPQLPVRLDRTLAGAIERAWKEDRVPYEHIVSLGFFDALETCSAWLDAKEQFDRCRKAHWPWIVNPIGWKLRNRRQRLGAALHHWKDAVLGRLAD